MSSQFMGLLTRRKRRGFTEKALDNVSSMTSSIEVPSQIREEFRENYDIVQLSKVVITKIARERNDSVSYIGLIRDLEAQLRSNTDGLDAADLERKLSEYKFLYDKYSSPGRLIAFRKESDNYINAYRNYPVGIIPGENECYVPSENDLIRIAIIEEYAIFLKDYIDIELRSIGKKIIRPSNMCSECGELLRHVIPELDGTVGCPRCFTYNRLKPARTTQPDASTKNGYEDVENFTKALNRYQGKIAPSLVIQGVRMSMVDIIEILDEHFASVGYPSCEDKSNRELNERGIREGTSVGIMLTAMTEIKLKCYCDVYYICREAWKWELNDLSDIEDQLISDYEATQKAWYSMPVQSKNRASSLPIWYRVYQHLRIRGVKCSESDFKIPKNVSSYNEIWKYMCDNSGNPAIKYTGI